MERLTLESSDSAADSQRSSILDEEDEDEETMIPPRLDVKLTPHGKPYLTKSPVGSPTCTRQHIAPYHAVSQGFPPLQHESEPGYVMIPKPENLVEAQRLANNYTFGFKKWKGHVTERPLEDRSEIVKELYSDTQKVSEVSTLRPGNVWYVLMFGWWMALLYVIVGLLMGITIVGRHYVKFCMAMAAYFLWPFGKFVHKDSVMDYFSVRMEDSSLDGLFPYTSASEDSNTVGIQEEIPLIGRRHIPTQPSPLGPYWRRPATYVWLVFGFPLLLLGHAVSCFFSWMLIIFIPIAKINSKAIRIILLSPPEQITISKSSYSQTHPNTDIIVYTHQAVNIYYYKYSVDGMNVIAVNLLVFVLIALVCGFVDPEDKVIYPEVKFILSCLAIIPLAYYIGMGITSLSAQTNFAVGAVLNATFGSVVEITLYILALFKGRSLGTECYDELVKASLVGSLLATMMLIPGLCMVIGGLKHSVQSFNPQSASVSSTLLFVSVAGAFAPTIFSKAFGKVECTNCTNISRVDENGTWSLSCSNCDYSTSPGHREELYVNHILPLVYACAILLPIAYIIGLIFSLKTHRSQIHDTFAAQVREESESVGGSHKSDHGHSVAHWGRVKSLVILLVSTVLMSLCAEILTSNIQIFLANSSVNIYFIGVTLIALVPNIPEIINGIQFALQNNISLSIEVGSSIALQVCLLQIPILVLVNTIHPMGFYLIFDDVHLWSVVFAVLMMNYVFQDGKSDYFQGSALCLVYLALIAMYFFAPVKHTQC